MELAVYPWKMKDAPIRGIYYVLVRGGRSE